MWKNFIQTVGKKKKKQLLKTENVRVRERKMEIAQCLMLQNILSLSHFHIHSWKIIWRENGFFLITCVKTFMFYSTSTSVNDNRFLYSISLLGLASFIYFYLRRRLQQQIIPTMMRKYRYIFGRNFMTFRCVFPWAS